MARPAQLVGCHCFGLRSRLLRQPPSRFGTFDAILLTSAIWSLLHIQYQWAIILQIFSIGLMLG
jgi:membrane protease YdiL (CAAX protease family)